MRIGIAAKMASTTPRALRYYESMGLLCPSRTQQGYRDYSEGDVDEVGRIRYLLGAGLSTETIAKVLPCLRGDAEGMAPICDDTARTLKEEYVRLSVAIESLESARTSIGRILGAS